MNEWMDYFTINVQILASWLAQSYFHNSTDNENDVRGNTIPFMLYITHTQERGRHKKGTTWQLKNGWTTESVKSSGLQRLNFNNIYG